MAFFCINYKKLHKANRFLILFFATLVVLYACHAVYFLGERANMLILEPVYFLCNQLTYPLYLVYVLLITKENLRIKQYWYIFIPTVFVFIFSVAVYMFAPEEEFAHLINRFSFGDESVSMWDDIRHKHRYAVMIGYNINLILFIIIGTQNIFNFRQRTASIYSNTEGKDMQKIKLWMYITVIFSFMSATGNVLGRSYFLKDNASVVFAVIAYTTLIILIAYFSYNQRFTIEDVLRDELLYAQKENDPKEGITQAEPLSKKEDEELKERQKKELFRLFEEEKIYLNSELSIFILSKMLGSNRTAVSKLINKDLDITFNKLVNGYRIEHAKTLMIDDPNKPFTLISEEAGFANEQSFYRNFKSLENTTPQLWKNASLN